MLLFFDSHFRCVPYFVCTEYRVDHRLENTLLIERYYFQIKCLGSKDIIKGLLKKFFEIYAIYDFSKVEE